MNSESLEKNKIIYENPEIVISAEEEDILKRLDVLEEWLDGKFKIPMTNITFGLDAVIGLFPGIGDTITALISSYIIRESHKFGAPFKLKFKMAVNVFIDWLVGTVPLVGDLFDAGFKANTMNVRLLKKYIKERK